MDSVEIGLAKLAEIRECVDSIALDGAKFFDKGKRTHTIWHRPPRESARRRQLTTESETHKRINR